ncbi:FHA domain-containing protein [Agreia sp.]|uniref:FHA domain-containing protein n=1 Tax=Agreia sp. TaxID=1872416 RepID=UPI0035BBF03A
MAAERNNPGRVVYVAASSRGARTVVVAPGLVAVIAGECPPAVLSRLWGEMSSVASSFERVVQVIPSLGADAVASFAVAAVESEHSATRIVSVVARGDSFVDVHTEDAAPRRFSSQGLQPWHLASFSGVTGLRIGGGARPSALADVLTVSGTELPLVLGAASADSVVWMLDESSTIVDPVAMRANPRGHTVDAERDDSEITLERAPERRRPRHGGSPENLRAAPVAAPRLRPCRVRIGSHAPFELHVPVYIGRRPRGPRQLGSDQVILVEVPSPTREVSASHLHIVQRGREVVVTDLKSTNGTAVTLPGSPRIKLQQGDSIVLPPYSRVEIGDGNVIEVLPAAD